MKNNTTALMFASEYGYVDMLKKLLMCGALIDKKDRRGMTALMYAARHGHIGVIETLVSKNANINSGDKEGWTALMHAAGNNQVNAIEILVDSGAADMKDKEGMTALMYAAILDRFMVIECFAAKGAMMDIKDFGGMTALMHASKNGQVRAMEALLCGGAMIDMPCNVGMSAVMYAAQACQLPATTYLLDMGAEINIACYQSPRRHAALDVCNSISISKILWHAGGRFNIKASDTIHVFGSERLDDKEQCLWDIQYKPIQVLETAPIDVSACTARGYTVLMAAVERGDCILVEKLLQKKADINAQDAWGRTALMLACRKATANIVACLVKYKPEIHKKDNLGHRLWAYLRPQDPQNMDKVRMLFDAGGEVLAEDLVPASIETEVSSYCILRGNSYIQAQAQSIRIGEVRNFFLLYSQETMEYNQALIRGDVMSGGSMGYTQYLVDEKVFWDVYYSIAYHIVRHGAALKDDVLISEIYLNEKRFIGDEMLRRICYLRIFYFLSKRFHRDAMSIPDARCIMALIKAQIYIQDQAIKQAIDCLKKSPNTQSIFLRKCRKSMVEEVIFLGFYTLQLREVWFDTQWQRLLEGYVNDHIFLDTPCAKNYAALQVHNRRLARIATVPISFADVEAHIMALAKLCNNATEDVVGVMHVMGEMLARKYIDVLPEDYVIEDTLGNALEALDCGEYARERFVDSERNKKRFF